MKRSIFGGLAILVLAASWLALQRPWEPATAQGSVDIAFDVVSQTTIAPNPFEDGEPCTWREVRDTRDLPDGLRRSDIPDTVTIRDAASDIVAVAPMTGTIATVDWLPRACVVSVNVTVPASTAYTVWIRNEYIATLPGEGLPAGDGDRPVVEYP